MSMTEDMSAFFKTTEFADTATLGGVGITGIFDRAYEAAAVGFSGAASTVPMFTLPSSSVPSNVVGMVFVHKSVSYRVAETHPDGTGITALWLEVGV